MLQEHDSLVRSGRGTQPAFLRVPPFPGATAPALAHPSAIRLSPDDDEVDALIDRLRGARVGGDYWSAQPKLPAPGYSLETVPGGKTSPERQGGRILWLRDEAPARLGRYGVIRGSCDPWHLLSGAGELVCERGDQLVLVAALAGVPVRYANSTKAEAVQIAELRRLVRSELLAGIVYRNPFTGEPMSVEAAIDLCASWRALIDSNRLLAGAYGFARWKRPTTAPLLWSGSGPLFDRPPTMLPMGAEVAVWRSRTSPATLRRLAKRKATLVEVEDGFIRSAGLGANCVPPLSIVLDRLGAHFDARQESDLESILQEGGFAADLLARAEEVRANVVALGLSKYDIGHAALERRADRRHILVPGQVEDDRAVLSAIGDPLPNLHLLRRARADAPDAYIIYKPHPDVEAGHRKGAVPDSVALTVADEVVRDQSISSLIGLVDEVQVNSSLAGFEALMRGKAVTTHGVPFYAGWGLTRDLGPVPGRRTAKRSLAELVAATLLVYPRYVDPVTRLPCPAEVVITRLSQGSLGLQDGPLVRLRRLQGWLKQKLAAF